MSSFYVHGSHTEEQARLSLLNRLLNEAYIRDIGPIDAQRVVDFGSGLGHFTQLLKQHALPGAYVLGLERDEQQLAKAVMFNDNDVEFQKADITQPDLRDEQWGSFDMAHARFVLEHVPDPLQVVQYMAGTIRPGGKIILADDDHSLMRLYPGVEGFDETWSAYAQSYIDNGNDPYVGRKLVALMSDAGLRPVRNGFTFFGSCAGESHFSGYVENLIGVIEGAQEAILRTGLVDRSLITQMIDRIETWAESRSAAIWYCVCYAIGEKNSQ